MSVSMVWAASGRVAARAFGEKNLLSEVIGNFRAKARKKPRLLAASLFFVC